MTDFQKARIDLCKSDIFGNFPSFKDFEDYFPSYVYVREKESGCVENSVENLQNLEEYNEKNHIYHSMEEQ